MPLPFPKLKNDVFSTLEYAEHRLNEFAADFFNAKDEDRDLKFMSQRALEIIASARETFDYLANDIVSEHLIPNILNKNIAADLASGKIKTYFPFYESQLGQKKHLYELSSINPSLYYDLIRFTRCINLEKTIDGTGLNCGNFEKMKDIVNGKKHAKIAQIKNINNSEIFVSGPNVKFANPQLTVNGKSIPVQWKWNPNNNPDINVKYVTEYRFIDLDREVLDMCRFSVEATKIIVKFFYDKHFYN